MSSSVMARGSFDRETRSVRVRISVDVRRGVSYEVPAFPGEPPCDAFLAIDDEGHVTSMTFPALEPPIAAPSGEHPGEFQCPLRLNADGSVELLLDDTVVPTRRLAFDWPGDVPRWFAWLDADQRCRLRSATFARPDIALDAATMRALRAP